MSKNAEGLKDFKKCSCSDMISDSVDGIGMGGGFARIVEPFGVCGNCGKIFVNGSMRENINNQEHN